MVYEASMSECECLCGISMSSVLETDKTAKLVEKTRDISYRMFLIQPARILHWSSSVCDEMFFRCLLIICDSSYAGFIRSRKT